MNPANKNNTEKQRLQSLSTKGGIMLFTIEKEDRLYKGSIILSAVEGCNQKRAVYVREYKYTCEE